MAARTASLVLFGLCALACSSASNGAPAAHDASAEDSAVHDSGVPRQVSFRQDHAAS